MICKKQDLEFRAHVVAETTKMKKQYVVLLTLEYRVSFHINLIILSL
jgi:hypothetical protein